MTHPWCQSTSSLSLLDSIDFIVHIPCNIYENSPLPEMPRVMAMPSGTICGENCPTPKKVSPILGEVC